ncbi:hypothetical protein ACPX19_02715 [Winogradskyella sp. HB-48]|uniref:hypothetical protein n=1 Tax=Winogradskyella sp. HB-48 TaxID=3416808 RepID=UPI003CE7C5B9
MNKRTFLLTITVFIVLFLIMDRTVASILEKGLKTYYGLDDESELALVGHSHLMLGVDKVALEKQLGINVSKYTREGVNVSDRLVMIEQLLNTNPKIKTVIYGVDAWTFTGEGLSANSYKLFYPFFDDPNIDDYIKQHGSFSDYSSKKYIKTSRYNEQLIAGAMRGYLGKWDNLKYGTVDITKLKTQIQEESFRKVNNDQQNIEIFYKTLSLLKSKGIKVILLHVPTVDLLETYQQESFNETMAIFENVVDEDVAFLDLQEPWSSKYELFYDPIHLNPKGQEVITGALIDYLKTH